MLAVLVTYYTLSTILQSKYKLVFLYESANYPKVIESISIFISCVLLLHTFSADWLDIVFRKTSNDLYRSHLNVTSNTVLWTIVLVGLYSYAEGRAFQGTPILNELVDLYLVGRVLFSIGYVIGAGIGLQSFRAIGFGLSFGPTIVIAGEAFGHSLVWMFKWRRNDYFLLFISYKINRK